MIFLYLWCCLIINKAIPMYPSLETSLNQTTFKKTLPPSEEMTNAVLELRQTMPSISSFKPHLNTHECHLNMIVGNRMNIPIKIVFFRNYPREKPLIFVTQWIKHPMISPLSCQIEYDNEFPWYQNAKLSQLLKKIQGKFTQQPPAFDSELDGIVQQLDNYGRQIESLRTKPLGTQPPPVPEFNLENTLKAFEYQENLYKECEQKNDLYMITAAEYNENLTKIRVVGDKFSKGKIIRELEKQIESEIQDNHGGKIQDIMQSYFQNRKKLHKLKMLKELYIES